MPWVVYCVPSGPCAFRHDLVADRMEESGLALGDMAGVHYSLYEMVIDLPIPELLKAPFDNNLDHELVKIKGKVR